MVIVGTLQQRHGERASLSHLGTDFYRVYYIHIVLQIINKINYLENFSVNCTFVCVRNSQKGVDSWVEYLHNSGFPAERWPSG